MADKNKMEMTQGPILPKIILFAFPILCSSFLQQLFNSADAAVVGRFAGPFALAAVGSNTAVVNLLVNFFTGLSVGANVIIARYIGQKDDERVRKSVPTVMVVAVASGFLLGAVGITIARGILSWVSTPPEVIDLATLYLRIYFSGMPFIMVFNFGSAILRSYGDTKRPLYALTLAGVVNVVLNLFFVVVLKMSVAGVGLATVISNAISGTIVFLMLLRHKGCIRLSFRNFSFDGKAFREMLNVGLPAGIQGTLFSVSNVVILGATNSFGAYATAGNAASANFEHLSYFVTSAFAQAAVTFTSQNYGAGEYERCKRVYVTSLLSVLVGSLALNGTMVLFRYPLVSIFTGDPEAIRYAVEKMMIVTLTQLLVDTYEIPGGCLRGLGKSMVPAVLTLFGVCGVRLIWVFFILPLHRSYEFLLICYPISWIVTGVAVTYAYFVVRKPLFEEKRNLLDY